MIELVAGHIPDGTPDKIRLAADAWADSAVELAALVVRLEVQLDRSAAAAAGKAGEGIQRQYRALIADTRSQSESNDAKARLLYAQANEVELQLYQIYGILGVIAAQWMCDAAASGTGVGLVKAAADRAAVKAAAGVAWLEHVARVLELAVKFIAENPRLILASRGVLLGTAIGGGTTWGAMEVQKWQGHREKVDRGKVRIALAAGALGGLVGVEVGAAVSGRFRANSVSKVVRVGGHVVGTVVAGAAGGLAGGLAGGFTAWALTGGELRAKDVAAMAWTGFGSGFASAAGAGLRSGRAAAAAEVAGSGRVSIDTGSPAENVSSRTQLPGSGEGYLARPDDLTRAGMLSEQTKAELSQIEREVRRDLAGQVDQLAPGAQHDALREFVDNHKPREGGELRPVSLEDLHSMADAEARQQLRTMGLGPTPPANAAGTQPGSPHPPVSPPRPSAPVSPAHPSPGPSGSSPVPAESGPAGRVSVRVAGEAVPPVHSRAALSVAGESTAGSATPAATAHTPITHTPAAHVDVAEIGAVRTVAETTGRDAVTETSVAQPGSPSALAPRPHSGSGVDGDGGNTGAGRENGHGITTPEDRRHAATTDEGHAVTAIEDGAHANATEEGRSRSGHEDRNGATGEQIQTTESAGPHNDSLNAGGRDTAEAVSGNAHPDLVGATAEGGGGFVPAHDADAGVRNCVPEAVSEFKRSTGLTGGDPSLISRASGLQGFSGDQVARGVGADWQAVESLAIAVADIHSNGGTALIGIEGPWGAHALNLHDNSVGDVVMREQVGEWVHERCGDVVNVWKVDTNGRPVGELRVWIEDNAVANYVNSLTPHIDTVGMIRAYESTHKGDPQQPALPLAPGQAPASRPGIHYPKDLMGHRPEGGAALLERPASAEPARAEQPLLNLDFFEFEAQFATDPIPQATVTPTAHAKTPTPELTPSHLIPDTDNLAVQADPSSAVSSSEQPRPVPDVHSPTAPTDSPARVPDATPSIASKPISEANSPAPQTRPLKPVPEAITSTPSHATVETKNHVPQSGSLKSLADAPPSPPPRATHHAGSPTAQAGSPEPMPETPSAPPGPAADAGPLALQSNPSKAVLDTAPSAPLHPTPAQSISPKNIPELAPLTSAAAVASAAAEAPPSATRPLAATSGRPGADTDELPSEPEEFPGLPPSVVPIGAPPEQSDPDTRPDDIPIERPEEYIKPPGTIDTIPGVPTPPDGPPDNAIPVIPHLPSSVPTQPPAMPVVQRPMPPNPVADPNDPEDDRNSTRDIEPLPRDRAEPPTHLPATEKGPDWTPSSAHYATHQDPNAKDAPQDPNIPPQFDPDRLDHSDPPGIPGLGVLPSAHRAQPQKRSVEAVRLFMVAQASACENDKRTTRQKPDSPPKPPEKPTAPGVVGAEGERMRPVGRGRVDVAVLIASEVVDGRPGAPSLDGNAAKASTYLSPWAALNRSSAGDVAPGDNPDGSRPTPWSSDLFPETRSAPTTAADNTSSGDDHLGDRSVQPPAADYRSSNPSPWAAAYGPVQVPVPDSPPTGAPVTARLLPGALRYFPEFDYDAASGLYIPQRHLPPGRHGLHHLGPVVYHHPPDEPIGLPDPQSQQPSPRSPDGDTPTNRHPTEHPELANLSAEPPPAPAEEPVSLRQLRTSNAAYWQLFKSNAASSFGNSVQTTALPILAMSMTGSTMVGGLATFAQFAPKVLFEPLAGYMSDFWDLRRNMFAWQSVGLFAAGGAGALVFFGGRDLGTALTAATLVEATAATFYLRSLRVAVRELTTPPQRSQALRLAEVDGYLAGVGGRVLGPILLSVAQSLPFAVNVASYAWNLATLRSLRNSFPPRASADSHTFRDVLRGIGEGAQALWHESFLRQYSALTMITNISMTTLNLRTAALITDAAMPGWAAGAVLGAGAVGGVAGGFLPAKLINKIKIDTVYLATLAGFTGVAALQAGTENPLLVAAGAFGVSVFGVGMNVQYATYEAKVAPERLFGRVSSVRSLILGSGTAAGGLVGGALLSTQGIVPTGWISTAAIGAAATGGALHYMLMRGRGLFGFRWRRPKPKPPPATRHRP
ncbi:MFS transporter [Nocardia sp. NBC_00403]|uniref:MFS transporter n=1 Tax=Nocardia sp. NBC_00403 TaxID=2975990 RepID=UPI002E23052E